MNLPTLISPKHQYELMVKKTLETYKASAPESTLRELADEAVAMLSAQEQVVFVKLLVAETIDSIILGRMSIPRYEVWHRLNVRRAMPDRVPAHWPDIQAGVANERARRDER